MSSQTRVLVVEDDPVFSSLVRYALTKANFDVLLSPDGLNALQVADSYDPHVILLDMYLPEMDGWEFLKVYRQTRGSHIPIIVTSADDIDAHSLVDIAEILPKPYSVQTLVQVVVQVTRSIH